MMPKERFELSRACAHCALKTVWNVFASPCKTTKYIEHQRLIPPTTLQFVSVYFTQIKPVWKWFTTILPQSNITHCAELTVVMANETASGKYTYDYTEAPIVRPCPSVTRRCDPGHATCDRSHDQPLQPWRVTGVPVTPSISASCRASRSTVRSEMLSAREMSRLSGTGWS